jgi:hypothetical protein
MRILVGFEDGYRIYRDVLAAGIRILRPHTEVETADLDEFQDKVERFDPHVVIKSSRPGVLDLSGRPAWVELSMDPLRPSNIGVGDRRWESTNPTLDVLLCVVDEAEELIQTTNLYTKGRSHPD